MTSFRSRARSGQRRLTQETPTEGEALISTKPSQPKSDKRSAPFNNNNPKKSFKDKTAYAPTRESAVSPTRTEVPASAPQLGRDDRPMNLTGEKTRAPRSMPAANVADLKSDRFTLFASCPRGLEGVLAEELTALSMQQVEKIQGGGGVRFVGGLNDVMRANLHSRVASRILLQVAEGEYRTEDDIYRMARQVKWEDWFTPAKTIRMKVDAMTQRVKSTEFIALRIKDAVCDYFRHIDQIRPSVDKHFPDIRVHAFVGEYAVNIYLDTSGEALFKRGWRGQTGEAPLRENLAAGILLLSGYNGEQSLFDPMCGSGSILIEGAMIALNIAPGLQRSFGFEKFNAFDAAAWQGHKTAAKQAEYDYLAKPIRGSDHLGHLIEVANVNALKAGIDDAVEWGIADALTTKAFDDTGMLVSNPPYGVRLEEVATLAALYPQMGTWLKREFAGWSVHLLTSDQGIQRGLRLREKRKDKLFNGALPCHLYHFEMVAGSNRD
jgi:putative N6-adenine-specific DNA methylase